ncbi:MAG: hypothetical protein JO037_23960 [Actinobacteria bacterium]|nr:hypothetical protein [Actinomycetota bacterium]
MSMLPDEQKVLDRLADDLGAQEPRLTSMFGIFTRLTESDGRPPEEVAFPLPRRRPVPARANPRAVARLRAAPPARRAGRTDRGRLFLLLAIAALLAMILIIHLTGIG